MRTDNKVCAHVFSPNREKQIKECDLLIVFGFSEEDDGMELQTLILGGDINTTKRYRRWDIALQRLLNLSRRIVYTHFFSQNCFARQSVMKWKNQVAKKNSSRNFSRRKSNDTADYF